MAEELTLEDLCNEPLPAKDNQTATPEPVKVEKDNLAEPIQKKVSTPVDGQETPVVEVEVTPYTAEDLKSIPLERLDSKRIPENVRPFYDKALEEKKSLQSGFTQKAQELAEYKRRLESGNQPATIEQLFDQNPTETMRRINTEIAQRRLAIAEAEPFSDEEKAIRRDMAKLENLKEDLNQRAMDNRQAQVVNEEAISRLNLVVNDTLSTIKNEFKDYDTRQKAVEQFAYSQGYTEMEIGVLTDPRIVGKAMAIKNFKMMNTLYEKNNAGKTADEKLVSRKANQLEKDRAPSGKEGKKGEEAETYDELDALLTSKKL